MSGLGIDYSKQIARELTKIAVYLPGTEVVPGDIVAFPFGYSRLLRRPKPYGSLEVRSNVSEMGIQIGQLKEDTDPDPYIFATRGGSNVSFKADGGANAGGAAVKGTLNVSLTKESALYFAAVDCRTSRLTNMTALEDKLIQRREEIGPADAYLVVSVTKAARALVMQASSSTAGIQVTGEVKGLLPGGHDPVSANLDVMVSSFSSAAFIKPWSNNVTVFAGLAKLSRRRDDANERFAMPSVRRSVKADGKLELVPVSVSEFVPEDE